MLPQAMNVVGTVLDRPLLLIDMSLDVPGRNILRGTGATVATVMTGAVASPLLLPISTVMFPGNRKPLRHSP